MSAWDNAADLTAAPWADVLNGTWDQVGGARTATLQATIQPTWAASRGILTAATNLLDELENLKMREQLKENDLFPVRCWVRVPRIPFWKGYQILSEAELRSQFADVPGTLFALPRQPTTKE